MVRLFAAVVLLYGAAAAYRVPAPLRASPHRYPRARQLVAAEFGILETVLEKLTQLTDLRIARASHILVKGNDTATLEQIAEWKREIGNDEELFAKYATEHSVCPSRSRGGDLGYFPRGKMVKRPAPIRRPRALCPSIHAGALSCLARLCLARRGVQPAAKAHPLHLSRVHQVMEFDRVVFNEEPGAVYGPGAMPTPWGARERVLARGGGRESTPSRMRAPAHPPPASGASPRRVEHARTRPTGARGATRPRTPHPHPQLARAHAAQCEPTLATT